MEIQIQTLHTQRKDSGRGVTYQIVATDGIHLRLAGAGRGILSDVGTDTLFAVEILSARFFGLFVAVGAVAQYGKSRFALVAAPETDTATTNHQKPYRRYTLGGLYPQTKGYICGEIS